MKRASVFLVVDLDLEDLVPTGKRREIGKCRIVHADVMKIEVWPQARDPVQPVFDGDDMPRGANSFIAGVGNSQTGPDMDNVLKRLTLVMNI